MALLTKGMGNDNLITILKVWLLLLIIIKPFNCYLFVTYYDDDMKFLATMINGNIV